MALPPGSINQFAYVTKDVQRSIARWVETMKAGPFYIMNSPPGFHMSYRGKPGAETVSAGIGFCGASMIELVQQTNDAPSVFREMLERRGEGLHHVQPQMRALSPAEFDAKSAAYKKEGFAVVSDCNVPLIGRSEFFDATEKHGFYLELCEFAGPSFSIFDKMYEEHRTWDGRNPVRNFAEFAAAALR